MAVTLTQIRAFLAVKSTGSVHAAAGQLLVSQPSVSAPVASLARELGVRRVTPLCARLRVLVTARSCPRGARSAVSV